MMIRVFVIAALLSGCSAATHASSEAPVFFPQPSDGRELCRSSRFEFSDNGANLLLWSKFGDPARGAVQPSAYDLSGLSVDCLKREVGLETCVRWSYRGREGLVDAQASSAAELTVLTQTGQVHYLPPRGDSAPKSAPDVRGLDLTRVTFQGWGSRISDALTGGNLLRLRSLFPNGFWTKAAVIDADGQSNALLADKSSLALSLVDRDRNFSLGLRDPWAQQAQIFRTPKDRVILFLNGGTYDLAGCSSGQSDAVCKVEPIDGFIADTRFSPIEDPVTGRLLGAYSARGIRWVSEAPPLRRLTELFAGIKLLPQAEIGLVALHKDLSMMAVRVDTVGSPSVLYLVDAKKSAVTLSSAECSAGSAFAGWELERFDLGTPDRHLFARLLTKKGNKRLAVYWHGGPGASIDTHMIARIAAAYDAAGYDLLVPEYSSSAGLGTRLASRIAFEGPTALDRDAELVSRWIAKRRYSAVINHGESFGALPSLALDRIVAPSGGRYSLLLVAPWLRARDPEIWAKPGSGASPGYQRKFEAAMLGIDYARPSDAFRTWQSKLAAMGAQPRNADIVLAENDDISRLTESRELSPTSLRVAPGTTHSTLVYSQEYRATLEAAIARFR